MEKQRVVWRKKGGGRIRRRVLCGETKTHTQHVHTHIVQVPAVKAQCPPVSQEQMQCSTCKDLG